MAYAKICIVDRCPEKTHGRLADMQNRKRRDLCKRHFDSTLKHFNKPDKDPQIQVLEVWGDE